MRQGGRNARAPKPYRRDNSLFSRNFRCMHEGPLSVLTDTYGKDDNLDDLMLVTKGVTDAPLARMTIRQPQAGLPWMEAHGFIEVHHVVPLAEAGRSLTDPVTDMNVLCANCHRMAHRQRGVCLTLDELKAHLRSGTPS